MSIKDMIRSSAVAAVISDPRLPDNPIIDCNDAFVRLTGYPRDEIVGRNCRFLRGEQTEAARTEELRAAIRERRPTMVEIVNYRKDGTPFRNAVMVAPIFGDDGKLEYFVGSQVEIPAEGAPGADDRRVAAEERIAGLTQRQREILKMMAAGKLNKQIAWELGLSERTVKMHRSSVLRALGVRTNADAIRAAIEAGF